MSTITREQAKDLRNAFDCWQQDYDPVEDKEQYDMFGLAMVAMDALQASLEAEAVAWRYRTTDINGNPNPGWSFSEEASLPGLYQPLFSAPPAPVSVPDLKQVGFLFVSDDGSVAYSPAGWPMKGFNLIGPIYGDVNACRAAMLQSDGTLTNEGTMQLSGNSEQIEPVSNRDELPLDYLQGHKDGLEWAAQLAEANHPQTGDWLYDDPIDLARAIRKGPDMPTVQAGNSPVTPDGWVMVPKEPTQAMIKAWLSEIANFRGHAAGYRAALEAAPQLEVNRG